MSNTEFTKDNIGNAVKEEIKLWRENIKLSLHSAALLTLPNDDPILKSATWLNFGMDVGKNVSLGFATLSSKAALPIWAIFKAQELYGKYYRQPKIDDAQKMLNTNYVSFRAQLANSIDQAERRFMSERYAKEVVSTLYDLYKNNYDKKTDDIKVDDKVGEVREFITKAKVIQTDNDALGKLVSRNLGHVAKRVTDLYLGTQAAGLKRILYVAKNPDASLPSGSYTKNISNASCSTANMRRGVLPTKGYKEVDTSDAKQMAELYANAHRMDIRAC